MHYSVLRLRGVRMAVVLVERSRLHDDALIAQLQAQLGLAVMLAARDDAVWKGVKARAQFDATPYLNELLSIENVEWSPLPAVEESELPF